MEDAQAFMPDEMMPLSPSELVGATLKDAQALMPTWAVPEDGKADEAAVDEPEVVG